MADPVLHIKDSYYFEVPKLLAPARYMEKSQFPDVWVKNDEQFQGWEAKRIHEKLAPLAAERKLEIPELGEEPSGHDHGSGLLGEWRHWQHEGANYANFGAPLDIYLERQDARLRDAYSRLNESARPATFAEFAAKREAAHDHGAWFSQLRETVGEEQWPQVWKEIKQSSGGKDAVAEFKNSEAISWSEQKVAAYNKHLSGKILLYPQPFGDLRNLYEPESGFNISKLMVVEVLVGLILFALFSWIASRIRSGAAPKGKLWNLFEVFLLFIRDQIARPAIGAHHDEHEEHDYGGHAKESHTATGVPAGRAIGGAGLGGAPAEVDQIHKKKHAHHAPHNPYAEADRFVPLLWTIFFFVLGCNLFGLVPWLGGPTASFGVTFALAMCTFVVVCISGMMKFGFVGFFTNQVPSMDLPLPLAIVLKPMIFAIELLGLLIKHLVLSIRLLANMVAGHLVILGILAIAFGATAEATFSTPETSWMWWIAAPVSVISATVFNLLELFVACLQAYIFTFLSALFIGASVHKH